MMFVGHYSFACTLGSDKPEPWHGLFTLVAEARDVDVALKTFRRLIRDIARRHQVFNGASEVYLDSCVELRAVPPGGLLTYVKIMEGENRSGISMALPGGESDAAVAYGWGAATESSESEVLEPFIRLRRT